MLDRSVERRTLRGAIAVVDGLAVWLLAVVLAAYAPGGPMARSAGRLLPPVGETMRAWWSTPGLGAFELLAYAGLTITVLGAGSLVATRSAVGRGLVARVGRWGRPGAPDGRPAVDAEGVSDTNGEAGFVFDAARNRRAARSWHADASGRGADRPGGATAWVDEVLGAGAAGAGGPPQDFLRGGSVGDGGGTTPARPASASASGAVDTAGEAAGAGGGELRATVTVSDGGSGASAALDERVLEAFDGREDAAVARNGAADGGEPTTHDLEGAADEEDPETASPATAPDDGDASAAEPTAAAERLAAAVSEARGKLAAIERQVSLAAADRSADRASRALGAIVADGAGLEAVERSIRPAEDLDLTDAVGDLRRAQTRLEDGVAAALGG